MKIMDSEKIRDWLEAVVKPLVTYPNDVRGTKSHDDMGILYTLTVNQADAGKIIGKEGQTSKALRVLLRSIQTDVRIHASLKIDVPELHRADRQRFY